MTQFPSPLHLIRNWPKPGGDPPDWREPARLVRRRPDADEDGHDEQTVSEGSLREIVHLLSMIGTDSWVQFVIRSTPESGRAFAYRHDQFMPLVVGPLLAGR